MGALYFGPQSEHLIMMTSYHVRLQKRQLHTNQRCGNVTVRTPMPRGVGGTAQRRQMWWVIQAQVKITRARKRGELGRRGSPGSRTCKSKTKDVDAKSGDHARQAGCVEGAPGAK